MRNKTNFMKRKDRRETKQKTRCLKIEAKRCKKIEAKQSEMKRKIHLLVSRNKAKRKRNGFCFASFRFDAKKIRSENGTPYMQTWRVHDIFSPDQDSMTVVSDGWPGLCNLSKYCTDLGGSGPSQLQVSA